MVDVAYSVTEKGCLQAETGLLAISAFHGRSRYRAEGPNFRASMVGLWPGRSSESSNSEPAAGTSAPGSIEMKGSKWASTPRGQCKVASLRPVASLRSSSSCKQRAKDELVPLAENSNRAAQPGADDAFLEAVMEANLPTMLTVSCAQTTLRVSVRYMQNSWWFLRLSLTKHFSLKSYLKCGHL